MKRRCVELLTYPAEMEIAEGYDPHSPLEDTRELFTWMLAENIKYDCAAKFFTKDSDGRWWNRFPKLRVPSALMMSCRDGPCTMQLEGHVGSSAKVKTTTLLPSGSYPHGCQPGTRVTVKRCPEGDLIYEAHNTSISSFPIKLPCSEIEYLAGPHTEDINTSVPTQTSPKFGNWRGFKPLFTNSGNRIEDCELAQFTSIPI